MKKNDLKQSDYLDKSKRISGSLIWLLHANAKQIVESLEDPAQMKKFQNKISQLSDELREVKLSKLMKSLEGSNNSKLIEELFLHYIKEKIAKYLIYLIITRKLHKEYFYFSNVSSKRKSNYL